VATDSGGPSEIVEHGKTGFLTPIDDIKGLADHIIFLLKNKHVGKEMGRVGFERAKNNFSEQIFVDGFMKIIRQGGRI
jgi:glycosyltransferase involved in cell wall biosynthesis